ncbi:MAG: MerR family transcriptional regulator [Treponema sp.]|nr:MerR family transcriptional regulator [Treponema sp.]
MASYTIGEVEELTGLKASILRYWETVIPGSAPKKDLGGRRSYSQRDVDLIQRMKFLIYEQKYSIEGARNRILEETQIVSTHADVLQQIHELRTDLTSLYLMVKKYRKK